MAAPEATKHEKANPTVADRAFTEDDLSSAWSSLTESKKGQTSVFNLLSRGFVRDGNTLIIHLNNSIEEPLLQSIKTDLVVYLRTHLGNNTIQIKSQMAEITRSKMIYTNKEKFEAMVEKNPLLNDLKKRFGLDADF